jgi:transient receptor potential cation channel subfamily M protein 3
VVSVGIAPWGVIENRHSLVKKNEEVSYHSISAPRSKLAALNNRHSHFLLVDNGTTARYGAEIVFRRRLEKYITKMRMDTSKYFFSSYFG